MVDESSGPGFATKQLVAPTGETYNVDAALYPQLAEWTWHYDRELRQFISVRGDVKVPLHHEQLKWHYQQWGTDRMCRPHIPVAAIRAIASQHENYQEMLARAVQQADLLQTEFGAGTMSLLDLLEHGLVDASLDYLHWLKQGKRYLFIADREHLIPGRLKLTDGFVRYYTLGTWLDMEYTGEWGRAMSTRTGLFPLKFLHHLQREMLRSWRRYQLDTEVDAATVKLMEEALDNAGLSIVSYVRDAAKLLYSATLPQ